MEFVVSEDQYTFDVPYQIGEFDFIVPEESDMFERGYDFPTFVRTVDPQ